MSGFQDWFRGLNDSLQGVLWIVGAIAVFMGMDAMAKELRTAHSVVLVVWARFACSLIVIAAMLGRRLPQIARTAHPLLQWTRAGLLLIATTALYIGLGYMPLAEATAITFLGPLIVTGLSVPLLGEKVGIRRWMGVACGFLGALVVIRPGTGFLDWAAIYPLIDAIGFALVQIITRHVRLSDHPLTTLFYTSLVGTVITTPVIPFFWTMPEAQGWMLILGLGTFGVIGHYAMIKSLDLAQASVIAPFHYSSLFWATLFGFVFFGDFPDAWTVVGAVIIAGSGLYVFHRERVRAVTV